MYKIFGIPNCDTVKKARTFLEKKRIPFEFVDFKKSKLTEDDILRWSQTFKGLPVNAKGVTYKKHKEIFQGLSEDAQIKFILENSSMIKRPILERDGHVLAFGFDETQYDQLLK
jgi:arsenate reductase